jgi:hypothetical protein
MKFQQQRILFRRQQRSRLFDCRNEFSAISLRYGNLLPQHLCDHASWVDPKQLPDGRFRVIVRSPSQLPIGRAMEQLGSVIVSRRPYFESQRGSPRSDGTRIRIRCPDLNVYRVQPRGQSAVRHRRVPFETLTLVELQRLIERVGILAT